MVDKRDEADKLIDELICGVHRHGFNVYLL